VGHAGSLRPYFIKLSLLLDREDCVDFGLQAGVRDHKWLQDAGLSRREFALGLVVRQFAFGSRQSAAALSSSI
jgi:hypothetical protein